MPKEKTTISEFLTLGKKSKLFTVTQFAQMVVSKKKGGKGVSKEYIFMMIKLGSLLPMNAIAHKLSPKILVIEVPLSEL